MAEETGSAKGLNIFEKYLTLWVALCIAGGIALGKLAPEFAWHLDKMAIYVDKAPVVSIPIAVCLFFMMYPVMVKIDFAEVLKAGKSIKPVGLTLVMVAINSLAMLFLYGPLGGFLLHMGKLSVPWQALLLSIAIYVALPLAAGYLSRKWLIAAKGKQWFQQKFLHFLTPVTIIALLITLVLLFSFKGEVILSNPLTILWIAIPLFIQTNLIFWLTYALARPLRLQYRDAAPSAMIGASNHFEVAIATAVMLFGLSSGAALGTVVGVLIEVPVMLMLVKICLRTQNWFPHSHASPAESPPV